ncbi:hypothetical protein R3X26_00555 [Vibrio sp. TH_r3]|uniref:XrtA system polysaccharide chain length determinant n=1 Tax=Vibrio sp. TH_r3 TaxID=3082084 RepID=UPI002955D983|nr:XrtA system polysaccharide chain length determinant [Vibrio sp. TH_r3]MDV7102892.1 hypothetical protein [Vibrio sp. TH_r3]
MQEMLDDVLQLVRGVWLKRRYILIFGWLLCPVGWTLVTMLPAQYTSEARVYADTRSILQPLLRGLAIQTDPTRELQLMVKTLLSRSNLEIIARDIDADIRASTSQEYEAIIDDLESNIKIRSAGRENLYTISYIGNEANYAKDVVQSALNVFVENTLSEQRIDTDQANEIIGSQIADYETRLIDAEVKLADFKREYRGFMPGSGTGYYSQLEQNQTALEDTQLALSEAKTRLESVRSQLYREESRATDQLSRVRTKHDERIDALQTRLDDLVFRYTENHPDVIETRRQLKVLEDLRSKDLASYSVKEILVNNPVYQDLKLTVNQLDNEVASLTVRERRYVDKIADLQNRLDTVPDVEAKLTALTRNYNITKEKYEQLLSRKESAQISQSVGDSSDEIKFRIIDAPRVPLEPSGPPRVLFLTVVLIFGLGSGAAVSFALSQITPVISSTNQLHQMLDYPVLGVVSASKVSGLAERAKRRTRWFALLSALLLLVFVAFIAVSAFPPVHERLMQAANVIIQGSDFLKEWFSVLIRKVNF